MSLDNSLSLLVWNIDGAFYKGANICKLDKIDVVKRLLPHNIVCLLETHCDISQLPHLEGFSKPIANVRPKTPGAPYHSGGILLYIKSNIRKGITFMPITNSEYCWLKLKRSFFNTPHDIYVVVAYVSNGSYSSKTDDILSLIENDAAKYSSDGSQIIACGDFNAHTNTDPDFQNSDTGDIIDNILNLPVNIPNDIPILRNNSDKRKVDERGKNLLNLCKTTGLRILNGRFFGDTLGNFTCYSHSGDPSTIDYILATAPIFDIVQYFHVNDLSIHSIHCSLSMSITTGNFLLCNADQSSKFSCSKQFAWDPECEGKFKEALASNYLQQDLSNLMEHKPNQGENIAHYIDKLSSNFSDIITKAAKTANIPIKTGRKISNRISKTTKSRNKPWFDNKCKSLKTSYDRLVKNAKNRSI